MYFGRASVACFVYFINLHDAAQQPIRWCKDFIVLYECSMDIGRVTLGA